MAFIVFEYVVLFALGASTITVIFMTPPDLSMAYIFIEHIVVVAPPAPTVGIVVLTVGDPRQALLFVQFKTLITLGTSSCIVILAAVRHASNALAAYKGVVLHTLLAFTICFVLVTEWQDDPAHAVRQFEPPVAFDAAAIMFIVFAEHDFFVARFVAESVSYAATLAGAFTVVTCAVLDLTVA